MIVFRIQIIEVLTSKGLATIIRAHSFRCRTEDFLYFLCCVITLVILETCMCYNPTFLPFFSS